VDTEYMDTDVVNDTAYYYAVTAVDTDDNESDFSDIIEAIPTIRPDSPEGLIARNDITSVRLDWNPVSMAEISGYNVYRSKTSGSDYKLINSLLLTQTLFTNLFLDPYTTYYYVVTCVDTNMVESSYSNEVSVTTGYSCTMQAEDAVIGGTVYIENNHAGYHGTGFTNFAPNNSSMEFTHMPGFGGGTYTLVFRYALGNNNRTGSLIVNGVTQSLTMKNTGEWTNYQLDSTGITLNSGYTNTIQFKATGSDFGNLDEVTIKAKEWSDVEFSENQNLNIPSSYRLAQNYPNPFNPVTTIPFDLPEASHVRIHIYGIAGRLITTLTDQDFQAVSYTHLTLPTIYSV